MMSHVENYAAALFLFLECKDIIDAARLNRSIADMTVEERQREEGSRRRQGIALRDSAMTAYHFDMAMCGVTKSINACATIKPIVDQASMDGARQQFNEAFPDALPARNAVGHIAKPSENPKQYSRHSVDRPASGRGVVLGSAFRGLTISGTTNGDQLVNSWKGAILPPALNRDHLDGLMSSYDLVCRAFAPVSVELLRLSEEHWEANRAKHAGPPPA
jgi:hypothetical protein